MSRLIEAWKNIDNYKETENGAAAFKSTLNKVYDLFAFGGAYRYRSDIDCILLFKEAYDENPTLALKCLFYLRDIICGTGERRLFRVCFKWLCKYDEDVAFALLKYIPEFGRWDDLLYSTRGTNLYIYAMNIMGNQLRFDLNSTHDCISLCAKWCPSPNTSSLETKQIARELYEYFGWSESTYRKVLSSLRERIRVTERLMSNNQWDKIDFSAIPSKAGLKYIETFMRRTETKDRYIDFINSKETNVHSKTLFPCEIVQKALMNTHDKNMRKTLEKFWDNLPDYLNGKSCKILCVCDTSGSMCWYTDRIQPIHVAISLSMYCAERIGEPFKNHFITFSREPELIEIKGYDFVNKVENIFKRNQCDNTNLARTFDLLLDMVLSGKITPEDLPETLVIISDMEIEEATLDVDYGSTMAYIRSKWEKAKVKVPKLIYWNVNARNNTILDNDENVSFVSGYSPTIFESILSGKTGMELMMEKLNSSRYEEIKA